MAFDYRYPTPLPSTKGWGPGWPICQTSEIVPDDIFQGGLNQRLKPLVDLLVRELQTRGYVFHPGWSWGFGCRATKGGSGDVPSFHSWGLALDFNAPENPFDPTAGSHAKLNNEDQWVVPFMRDYGFFWLGPSIGDWMHFSFVGSPQDADDMLAKAQRELGDDVNYDEFEEGVKTRMNNGPEPNRVGPKRFGWRFADWAATRPMPEAHSHTIAPEHFHEGGKTGPVS